MIVVLNEALVKKQNITEKQRDTLYGLYNELSDIFCAASDYDEEIDMTRDDINGRITELEYNLQDNWNFPRDKSMHRYWYRLPQCTCPIMDNDDMTMQDVIMTDCPWHGARYQGQDDICQQCWDPDCEGC